MRNEAGRQGVNAPIQATASDICLDALIRLHDQLDPELAAIVLTVHDSIVLEVRVKALAEVVAQVKATMEDVPLTTSVPFRVDVAVGPNWGDTKPYA
jgi:DNA polymerase-1